MHGSYISFNCDKSLVVSHPPPILASLSIAIVLWVFH